MARKVNFIEEINSTKDTWKLKIRIINLWRVEKSSAPSLEMIFMDEKGDKIQAVVKNNLLAQWESYLKERNTYIAENFEAVSNDGEYRASNHPFKLIFQRGTIMKNQDLSEIPQYIYHFTTFEEILSGQASTDVLVDVIGEFIDIELSQPDGKSKKVVFCMKDQRGNSLSCTLWGQFGTQLLNFEANHKFGPIVVILTLAKIREPKGGNPVTIQNTMYGSKLFINENIPEIQQYINSLDSNKVYESYSQRISQLSACSQIGSQDKFFHNTEVKTISEMTRIAQESICVTVGKIEKLFANGWYYDGCPYCNKKVDSSKINTNCPGCGKYLKEVLPRYRVEVKVSYKHDSMKFVLWNRECEQLINRRAVDLRKLMIAEGELNPLSIPQAVDDIVTKSLAFKIKVQPTYNRCSVSQVSEDAQLIESIVQKFPAAETITLEKGKSVSSVVKDDDVYGSQSLSATADYDPDLLGSITPAKRVSSNLQLEEIPTQDLASTQLSSTKLAKHIKME